MYHTRDMHVKYDIPQLSDILIIPKHISQRDEEHLVKSLRSGYNTN